MVEKEGIGTKGLELLSLKYKCRGRPGQDRAEDPPDVMWAQTMPGNITWDSKSSCLPLNGDDYCTRRQ